MTDFSWPVFYRLTIKNEKELPRYVIPGRRLRINLTMVNELDMFRGDDILAECPIPIRVAAIPIEDNSSIDNNGQILNHHEISCDIQTKNVRVKPVIERNGNGTVVIDLAPSPTLRYDEELMFILQIGVSSSSRIFNHVIPVSTTPFVMVSPLSAYAKENLRREKDFEHANESDDDDSDEPINISLEAKAEHGEARHVHGPNCSPGHGKHTHHHEHDEEEGAEEHDGDFGEDFLDEDWEGEGEDGLWDDGEGDDDDEHDMISSEVLAVYVDDEDLYETPSTLFSYQSAEEEYDTTLADLKGVYHAFVCDPLLSSPLHPQLQSLVESKEKEQQQANADSASPEPVKAPISTTNARGMQVVGAGLRRAKALPPGLKAKQDAAAAAQAAPETTTTATTTTTTTTAANATTTTHKYPTIGMSKTPGEGADMFQMAVTNPRFRFLDPLNGLFEQKTASNTATLKHRQVMAMATYAYVKVVQGLSIGGRIWDGAIYLIKVLQRLFMTSHLALDGARCLELGSGTGILGIWWWQLVQQRTLSQLNTLCEKYNVKKHQVEAVMALICNGDFKPAAKVFLGGDKKKTKKGEEEDPFDEAQIYSITIPTNVYTVANMMKSFTTAQPAMILTDQPKVMSLLQQNSRFNTTAKFPLYNQRIMPGSITIKTNGAETTIAVTNQSNPHTQLPLPISPVTGLHSLTCDWAQPLNKHIYKTCGVYIPSSTAILYTKPPKTLQKDIIQIELPPNVDQSQVTFTPGFDQITDLSSTTYKPLRDTIHTMYSHYESLENALESPNKQAITGLEEMLLAAAAPNTPKFVQLPGLDVIFAIECLYNDRYFQSLQNTIVSLYQAHMFAFAQRLYLHTATKSTPESQPKLQLPIIVLSYRFRATHEEELIKKTFFHSLRQFGLYHTECPLFRLLGESSIHTDTMGIVNTVAEQVLQRNKERKDRESAIRNALGDLDLERQHNTRLAVIFYSPGTVNTTTTTTTTTQTAPEQQEDVEPQVLSPLPYLTPNAQFWFKLFQKF